MTNDRAERARKHLRVWRDKVCEAERVPDLFEYDRLLDEVEGLLDEEAPSCVLTADEFDGLRALVEQELVDTANPERAALLTVIQTKLFGEGGRR